jgi:hypothetical protein
MIVAAGAAGAIVSWTDGSGGLGPDILALQVLDAGTVDAPPPAAPALAFAPPSPNPARGRQAFSYALPRPASVTLAVYDLAGRRVRILATGAQSAGTHAADWDLRDERGAAVRPGVYLRPARGGRPRVPAETGDGRLTTSVHQWRRSTRTWSMESMRRNPKRGYSRSRVMKMAAVMTVANPTPWPRPLLLRGEAVTREHRTDEGEDREDHVHPNGGWIRVAAVRLVAISNMSLSAGRARCTGTARAVSAPATAPSQMRCASVRVGPLRLDGLHVRDLLVDQEARVEVVADQAPERARSAGRRTSTRSQAFSIALASSTIWWRRSSKRSPPRERECRNSPRMPNTAPSAAPMLVVIGFDPAMTQSQPPAELWQRSMPTKDPR